MIHSFEIFKTEVNSFDDFFLTTLEFARNIAEDMEIPQFLFLWDEHDSQMAWVTIQFQSDDEKARLAWFLNLAREKGYPYALVMEAWISMQDIDGPRMRASEDPNRQECIIVTAFEKDGVTHTARAILGPGRKLGPWEGQGEAESRFLGNVGRSDRLNEIRKDLATDRA